MGRCGAVAAACWVLGAGLAVAQPKPAAPREPREILDRVDDLFRGPSSHGRMTMKVVTLHFTRELSLEQWTRGKDRFLVRILEPLKEKGVATLRSGENIWNFLPKLSKVVKVPPTMMAGAWMGSHFTNDDLVKESRMADDFTVERTFEGERGGERIVELTLRPRPGAVVVWGEVVVTVRAGDDLPLRIAYLDEDLKPARTVTFSDVQALGGRTLPTLMRVEPHGKSGESTEIRFHALELGLPLDDEFFAVGRLQR